MLKIQIPDQEEQLWDEEKEVFIYNKKAKGCELILEHSLLSISKWESIWCKPFLVTKDKSVEEMLSYVECMVVTPTNVDPDLIRRIPQSEFERINAYINNPSTASTINTIGGKGRGSNGELVTSELIYYWMTALSIPFECQKWHLNRLLALIRICEIKNDPKGQPKMSANETRDYYDQLNERNKKLFNTKG